MVQAEFFTKCLNSEIRQQMESVLALIDRLSRQELKTEARVSLSGIGDAAATVLQIISASQDLSCASEGGLSFSSEAVLLHLVADDLQTRWSDRALRVGLTLLVSYHGEPLETAQIDRQRLLQAFDGVIGLSLAGARSGVIEASLHAAAEGDNLRLEGRVRGGSGRSLGNQALDIQEVETLFGLEVALSLALCRHIVESQGGILQVEANQGGGDTLVFDLLAPKAPKVLTQASKPTETTAHILVVDDNATNRMVAEALCAMFDCTTEAVENGVEAIEAASSGRFDLILMDIKMPQMDGVAATQQIRALPDKAGLVPIIALTANADPEDSIAYFAAGMNGVVEKPMKPEHLLKALQDNLDSKAPAGALSDLTAPVRSGHTDSHSES